VDEHQLAEHLAFCFDVGNRNVERTAAAFQHVRQRSARLGNRSALDLLWEGAGGGEPIALRVAEPDGVETLVHGEPVEICEHSLLRIRLDEVGDRLRGRVRDQRRAHIQIAGEPAQGKPVDERRHRVGDERERDGERQHESKCQTHAGVLRVFLQAARTGRARTAECVGDAAHARQLARAMGTSEVSAV